MENKIKPAWQSRTFWASLVLAIVPLWPAGAEWIAANPVAFSEILAGVFFVLRLISKDKVTIA